MAHYLWQRRMRSLVACALALAAMEARALSLGEPDVRSALGEALDVRIPISLARGESIEPACFKLAAEGSSSAPRVVGGAVSLERSAGGTFLRLRTGAAITDPAVAVGIVAGCRGLPEEYRREYTVAIGATRSAAPEQTAAVPAPATAAASPPSWSMLPAIATLIARIGDTLESIANAIFPGNRAARRSYIDALRESNPPLAPLSDNDQIPVDTPVALPDLRTYAKAPHIAPEPRPRVARAELPAPKEAPVESAPAPLPRAKVTAAKPKPRAERPAVATLRKETTAAAVSPEPRVAKTAPPAAMAKASGDFVLKLSAAAMDLSPSRGIDDRAREQLRERLMVLDSDDQVSALLSLRHSVKDLESQVADLRLKLAEMPSSFPAPRAPVAASPIPAPVAASPAPAPVVAEVKPAPPPAPVVAPKPEIAKPEPLPVEVPKAVVEPQPEPAKVEAPPKVETPKVEAQPPKPEAAEAKKPPVQRPALATDESGWLDYGLWALAFLFILVAVMLAVRLARRNRQANEEEESYDLRGRPSAYVAEPESEPEDEEIVVAEELPMDLEVAPEIAPPTELPRREMDADVELPTHIPSNTEDLRRRYIEERFPEIGKGAISLDDPDSVVKAARLFYEDGALPRAVELLQYAIERRPEELKSWLALFEIFRLESLPGEFAELAGRFKELHGKSDYWPKVQYFGREIDLGNDLYKEAPINSFETIGPAKAKRIAAESNVDPIAENWLGAPMDFENEVLANELRMTLMVDAGINEQDLVPNPMPALRNIEMFNVA